MPNKGYQLSDKLLLSTKPKDKDYKLYDRDGLCILIRKTGHKVWQYHYKYSNKRKTFTIGPYLQKGQPGHVGLKDARMARHEVRALLDKGIDPNIHKQSQINITRGTGEVSFELVAREWHGKGVWVSKHAKNILSSLEINVFPHIGTKNIEHVKPQDIVQLLEKIESRDALDVAHRVCQRCCAIFDYAITKGVCEVNPANGRSKFLKKRKVKHRPHLKEEQLPAFINALDNYHGRDYIKLGVQILMRTFVRPGELRNATWDEFDFDKNQWRIPAERMKMRKPHIVPLSNQVSVLLGNLHKITGYSDYLFPSVITPSKPISDVTMHKVLRILNFKNKDDDVVVPHGFRHTASTILNENRFNGDVIERQLAHKDKDKVRSVYNHAEYPQERVEMMQWYSDHLDGLVNNSL